MNNNVNMAADSYIRQFEEAYSASYSNISPSPSHAEAGSSSSSGKYSTVLGSPLKTSSPTKTSSSAFLSYHNLGLGSSYYPQLSPDKQHQYLHSPEADTSSQQQQQQSQQHLVYHANSSYNGDMSSDYIQPCHIFQVCCDTKEMCNIYFLSLRWTSMSTRLVTTVTIIPGWRPGSLEC